MRYTGARNRNLGCWLTLLRLILFFVAVYLFRYEIVLLWQMILPVPQLVVNRIGAELASGMDLVYQLLFIAYNLAGILLFSLFIVYVIAGIVFPVSTASERRQAIGRVVSFVMGQDTPVLLVRAGQLVKDLPKNQKAGSSVAIVDLDSAIVLNRGSTGRAGFKKLREKLASVLARWIPRLARARTPEPQMLDLVRGPGIAFLHKNQKLRGVVSLTNQARANPGILVYTSDGVELKTSISAVFSVGQPASVVTVAYLGNPVPENLRVLSFDPETKKIKSISDELDEVDKQEIHRSAMEYLAYFPPNALLESPDNSREQPPYPIDKRRIFAAVYARARQVGDSKMDDWTSLPAPVATQIFRDMISQVSYNSLFLPDDPANFPLQSEFKPNFARKVRHQGVMSYQFVHRLDGQPPAEGQRLEGRQFRLAPVQELRASKVLRDRGIKVLHAGFSELTTTRPRIRPRQPDTGSTRWQKEADQIRAGLDLDAESVKIRARSMRQREMITKLSQIINKPGSPEEVRIREIFNELKEMNSQPSTRPLVPDDTVRVLKSLDQWLSSSEQGRPTMPAAQSSRAPGEPPKQEQSGG